MQHCISTIMTYLYMPPNESTEVETAYESSRSELLRIFDGIANDPKYKDFGVKSNLTAQKVHVLKSLKKRIREGLLTMTDTDKCKRFACLTTEQYIQSGLAHVKGDLEILHSQVE